MKTNPNRNIWVGFLKGEQELAQWGQNRSEEAMGNESQVIVIMHNRRRLGKGFTD